jgi:hypothetical protein
MFIETIGIFATYSEHILNTAGHKVLPNCQFIGTKRLRRMYPKDWIDRYPTSSCVYVALC